MNLDRFFKQGFDVGVIPRARADELLACVEQQSFVEGDGFYAGDNFGAPLITAWESDHVIPSQNRKAPAPLQKYWDELARSNLFAFFTRRYGPFSQGCPMINYYQKGDGMVWHTDSMDSTFITVCLYLTPDIFDEEDGGYLRVGRSSMEDGFTDVRTVSEFERILPNHGVWVCLNNTDASNVHRVEPLITDKKRYTLLSHLGYAEHTLTDYRLKKTRGIG